MGYALYQYGRNFDGFYAYRDSANTAEELRWELCEASELWEVRRDGAPIAEFEGHNAEKVRAWLADNPEYWGKYGTSAWRPGMECIDIAGYPCLVYYMDCDVYWDSYWCAVRRGCQVGKGSTRESAIADATKNLEKEV